MNKKVIVSALVLVALIIGGWVGIAHGNPIGFVSACATSAASSTTSGIATTSSVILSCDAYTFTPRAFEGATLLLQASSSPGAIVNVAFQYSQDGLDWYEDDLLNSSSTIAQGTSIAGSSTYSWVKVGGAVQMKALNVPTPVRYVRAVFTGGQSTSTIFAQIIPKRQQSQ